MKKMREKCHAIGCKCVKVENLGNELCPGLGSKARSVVDRRNLMEILAGKEPWKEERVRT